MPYSAPGPFLGAQTASAYQVSRSLRFRSSASAYLSRTPASAGNRQTWTWSGWVKRGALSSNQVIFACGSSYTTNTYFTFYFGSDNTLVTSTGTAEIWRTTAVYRDPSAFYHLVLVVDTTNATANNRTRLWVNGSEVTNFTRGTNLSLSTDYGVNDTIIHYLGRDFSGVYIDDYLAEVNFIDGQALTPSSFGQSNALTGVWEPKAYAGSYGTNGFYLPFSLNTTSTYAGSFSGSAQYLSVANNSGFYLPAATNWTLEAWVYSTSTNLQQLFTYGNATISVGADVGLGLYFTPGSSASFFQYTGSVQTNITTGNIIPLNQWFHIAVVNNSGTVTMYIDGVASGTVAAAAVNNSGTYQFYIANYNSGRYVTGQISNVRVVKGTAVYTSNFTPPTSNLTAITNTVLLTLQNNTIIDNSTNAFTITNTGAVSTTSVTPFVANVASDASGQNNGWIPANINVTSSGTTYDSMIDSPTNYADGGNGRGNYAVLNPLDVNVSNTQRPTNGNLTYPVSSAVQYSARSTIFVTSGKWYAEFTISSSAAIVAVVNSSALLYGYTAANGIFTSTTSIFNNGTQVQSGLTAFSANDVIGVAFDADANTVQFYRNGSTYGTAVTISAFSGPYTFQTGANGAVCTIDANFGQRPFVYSNYGTDRPAATFLALNTQNLPAPALTPSP